MKFLNVRGSVCRVLIAAAIAALIAGCGSPQTRAQRYFDRGMRYFNAQQFAKANLEFQNALQANPLFMPAHLQSGRTAERLGDPRRALAEYQTVVTAEPGNLEARLVEARLFVVGSYSQRALDLIKPALISSPHDPRLLTIRGAARAQLGDQAGAFEDVSEAYRQIPDDEYCVVLLASLLKQMGKIDAAIDVVHKALQKHQDSLDLHFVLANLEEAQGNFTGAQAELQRLVQLEPQVMTRRYQLAQFLLRRKNTDAAEQTLRAAVAAAPQSDEPKLVLVDFERAQRGDTVANSILQDFANHQPSDNLLQLQMAEALGNSHESEKAEALCRKLIESAGDKPDGLLARDLLAVLLVGAGKGAEARMLADQVLKVNPQDARALLIRARLELTDGNNVAAISDLRAELRGAPNSPALLELLAEAYTHQGDVAVAEDTLRSALQSNPRDIPIRLDLAQLLKVNGKAEEAETVLNAVVTEAPRNLAALEALFQLQASRKDYGAALNTATAVAAALPNQGIGAYLKGTIDQATGKTDAAVQDYEGALMLQPDSIEPLTALVDLQIAQHQQRQAQERLDWVISKVPRSYVAYNLKGQLLTSEANFGAAAAAFEAAIAIKSDWWVPYQNLARSQTKSGHVPASIDTLKRGLEHTHYNPTLAAELAGIYELQHKPDAAIDVYEQALTQDPKSTAAAGSLAMLLVSYRGDSLSLMRAKHLIDSLQDSHDPSLEDDVGWVRFKTGDVEGALVPLQDAASAAPESALFRYHLGMAQLRSGDAQNARLNIKKAVGSGRPFLGVADAKATLASL